MKHKTIAKIAIIMVIVFGTLIVLYPMMFNPQPAAPQEVGPPMPGQTPPATPVEVPPPAQ